MLRSAPDAELSKPTPSGFCLAQGEYFMICPYNPSHQITNERYMRHVANCRLNYKLNLKKQGKSVGMCVCRYNYTHQLPAPELLAHQEICPDKHNLIRTMSWVKPKEVKKEKEDQAKEEAKAQAQIQTPGLVQVLGQVQGLVQAQGQVQAPVQAQGQVQGLVKAQGQVQGLDQGQGQVQGLENAQGQVQGLAIEQGQPQVRVSGWGGRGRGRGKQFPNPCQIVPGGYESDGARTDISTTYSGISSTSGAAGNAAEAGKTAKKPPSEAEKSDWEAVRLLDLKNPDRKPKNK